MADLRSAVGDRSRPERGQIILVAAFALAVTFIALALVVNSAIFTENLASRGELGGSDEALYFRAELASMVGETIGYANVHNTSDLSDAIETNVANTSYVIERQAAANGAFVNVTLPGPVVRDGSRITQNESSQRAFTSANGASDWSVVEDVQRESGGNGTRAFVMNVTKSSLSSDGSSPFTIRATQWTNAGTDWQLRVWRDGSTSDVIVVEVENGAGAVRECRTVVEESWARIRVTEGTIDGRPCQALRRAADPGDTAPTDFRFAAGIGSRYNVSFANGTMAAGNYSLVTTNTSIAGSQTLNGSGSRASPYGTPAAYSIAVDYRYDTPKMTYRTRVRVAPGEPT